MKQRTDYGSKADGYFDSVNERMRPLARELRALVLKTLPNASEVIKWGVPVYEQNGRMWICSIRASKDYVALQFGSIATRLDDPDGLLEGSGRNLRHVKIRSKDDMKRKLFTSWIKQAAKSDAENAAS